MQHAHNATITKEMTRTKKGSMINMLNVRLTIVKPALGGA